MWHRFSAEQVTPYTAHQFSNVLNLTFEEVMHLNSFPIPWLLETILKNVYVYVSLSVSLCVHVHLCGFPKKTCSQPRKSCRTVLSCVTRYLDNPSLSIWGLLLPGRRTMKMTLAAHSHSALYQLSQGL